MSWLLTIQAAHRHTAEGCHAWGKASGASYEWVCHICQSAASLVYDLTYEYTEPLPFAEEVAFITDIRTGHGIPSRTYHLRGPPRQ